MPHTALERRRARLQQPHCQTCSLASLCLPLALQLEDLDQFDAIIRRRAPLKKGEMLFRQGDAFTSVFAVRSGSLKQVTSVGGEEQLTNFYLPSELVGLDGIDESSYPGSMVALETTTVCEIPFDRLNSLAEDLPELRLQLYRSMSKEMRDDRRMIRLLSRKTADERLASFLTGLSERFRRRGYSAYSFRLSMSRADIGNHLGLAVETVSRILGRFQSQGLVAVSGREVNILDLDTLAQLAEGEGCI
ncbi:fumarate/nitrate reduction transcriptional regulator Fnr [Halomonas pacifica]|uniref:Fumarate/nitrate reduction transcriptional regulator Fnr n=1 Tax=Bisbaumannia pacifica TaxID=77098 RepID=A0A510XCM0_9GAMM|nr:fumarate/nitrate reduction transcriptional regulator Fnr [Halomonas pacifica]MBH8581785.1 fumarate/nitrate reduction transcriptional regulator Fnr [Halomonas pacifica]MDC8803072.1 fumarate/nitrate reduction transcriptional regulator Fnr [Halomonas pacifica]GEK49158.1 transcriptional activator protein anr [Halomonas pacifica]